MNEFLKVIDPSGSITLDCSIIPLNRFPGLFQVATTDFFFPLVEDPYRQGEIAAANVLSDLYAVGVSQVDTVLMSLAVSNQMEEEHQQIITKLMMKGFADKVREAGGIVTGGQTIYNPWCIIGGVAISTVLEEDLRPLINRNSCKENDVIILTKPLGTQVAVNAYEWLKTPSKPKILPESEVIRLYKVASASMARLNQNVAKLLKKYEAKAATDVTGFGLYGHLKNLVEAQKNNVSFSIETLPLLRGTNQIDEAMNGMFKLKKGLSAETSGGIVAIIDKKFAKDFCDEMMLLDGWPCWVIGKVIKPINRENGVNILENPKIVEI